MKDLWDPIDRWVFKDSFKTRFAGYTYLVKAKFSGGLEVSGLFKVAEQSEFDKAVRTGKKAKAIVSEVIRAKKAPNDVREILTLLKTPAKITTKTGTKTFGKAIWGPINFILSIADFHDWFLGPRPSDGDSNNIIGG